MFLLKKRWYLSNCSKGTFLSCSWECYIQQISSNHGRQLRWERFLLCIAQRLWQWVVTAKASQTVSMENKWEIWTWSRLPGGRIEMYTEKLQYECWDELGLYCCLWESCKQHSPTCTRHLWGSSTRDAQMGGSAVGTALVLYSAAKYSRQTEISQRHLIYSKKHGWSFLGLNTK